jgi:predicted metal-dependent hydrolase
VQASFNRQERQTAREYVSGESHYLFGKKYRLDVQESNKEIAIKGTNVTKIIMLAPLYATLEQKELAMHSWYKSNLLNFLNSTLEIWDKKLATSDYSWSIRKMKTKWGSCNKQKKKLIFNLELAKKPKKCIDYVVLHELLHLIEPKHNSAFTQLLNKNMPNWVAYKEELNSLVLPKYKTKTRT